MKYCPYCGREIKETFAFCPFCGKAQNLTENNDKRRSSSDSEDETEESKTYYFENLEEFLVYSNLFGKQDKEKVIWKSGDKYLEAYKKGYDLVEQGRFQDAINQLKQALELNPIGINARFEMCEAYIHLKKYSTAKATLLEMKDFLVNKASIARFYRRYGYIETELRHYSESAACYIYSMQFEKSPTAAQELIYIASESGEKTLKVDHLKALKKANIPVIQLRTESSE